MKKILVSAILGLVAVASVQAQSSIRLYSYGTPTEASIRYGAGSGGTVGNAVDAGNFTVGVYYAVGDITSSANVAIGGATTQGGANTGLLESAGLTLATGVGSTAAIGSNGGQNPGDYANTANLILAGVPGTGSPTVTIVLVAYNGADYASSSIRGHSAAFTMTAVSSPGFALKTGLFANGFAVAAVPEPSTFALAGLGLASLLIFRRRK